MRELRLALVAVLAMSAVTGCSPGPEPVLAVAAQNGRPVALLVPCGASDGYISVYPAEASSDPAGTSPRWTVRGPMPDSVAEVTLMGETPAGWAGDGPDNPGFARDLRYEAGASSGRQAISVLFTLEAVERLGPDEVLVPDDGETRVMTRSRFEKQGRESCD